VVRERKNFVAVLEADNHIKLTPIEIAGTDGASVKIANGIGEGVRVVLSLPNTVPDGAKVNPVAAQGAPPVQPVPPVAPAVRSAPAANPQQPK
jgi:hypothetical protein